MIPFFLFLWLIYLIYCINKDKGHICPMCGSETSKYKPLELSHPEKDDAVFLNQFVKAKQAARIQQSSTKKMKICSYCGDRIDEDLKYCHYCGSTVGQTSERTEKSVQAVYDCGKCNVNYCDQCSYEKEIDGKLVQLCLRCDSQIEKVM